MRATPLALAAALACAGCSLPGFVSGDPDDDDRDPGEPMSPPPVPPPLPSPAVYVRGSLLPQFALTPTGEQGRFDILGVRMQDSDFVARGGGFVSIQQKLDEIAGQIGAERGAPVDLIPPADRVRAQRMPFRGNPSDVDLLQIDGASKAYVALGGDLGTPGNEVAAVDLDDGTVTRVKVGVRPLRTATIPAGLVFVCNQYSNYVSIIDARTDQLLRANGAPVEIATDYYCTDILVAATNTGVDDDRFDVYLANSWRASLQRYPIELTRDPVSGAVVDVAVLPPAGGDLVSTPAADIRGVGANPGRLSLSEDANAVYVANVRGGEVARVDRSSDTVTRRIAINGASIDVVQVRDRVFVPTTTIDRGLLDRDEPRALTVETGPIVVEGLDGQPAEAHPGAMFDGTRAYNFEDLRNGVVQLDAQLTPGQLEYLTDDISPEPNFVAQQRVLSGAIPQAIVRTAAGDRVYLAHSGSDQVQELEVAGGTFGLRPVADGRFTTSARPFALALDEAGQRLAVATWGGEVLEVFDTGDRQRVARIDLGYAALDTAPYPATGIERGQFFYFNAGWSNNGRKACTSCHVDELQVDGVGYANGATAPTAYHQVRPNWNLITTDNYFWNGSFSNGSYASLAFAAQSRTNCELVLFGLTEGPSSDPATRIGDPSNRITDGNDAACRPEPLDPATGLPANFDAIAGVIAAQKIVADQVVQAATGSPRAEVTRLVDFYSVSQLRLPPNPLTHLRRAGELDAVALGKLDRGEVLFTSAGCANCHQPDNERHPFTDGREHGAGADWPTRFVNRYLQDERIELPDEMIDSLGESTPDREINIHTPLDYFAPFCFTVDECLRFEDPLAAIGDPAEETRRLALLDRINLADPERGFIPGNVFGQPRINTPSLRAIWWQPNILHHGLAGTIPEAILAPGHPALREGERGFAINALGEIDVHGVTSTLAPDDVEALVLFVESIE